MGKNKKSLRPVKAKILSGREMYCPHCRVTLPLAYYRLTGSEPDPAMLKADGFDDCVVGAVESCHMPPLLVYDPEKIVRKLMRGDDMTEEEAWEYYQYNIAGAYVGAGTPLFLNKKPKGQKLSAWVDENY